MSGSLSRSNPCTRPPGSHCTERKTPQGSVCKLLEIKQDSLSEQKTHTHTRCCFCFSHPNIFLHKKMQRFPRKETRRGAIPREVAAGTAARPHAFVHPATERFSLPPVALHNAHSSLPSRQVAAATWAAAQPPPGVALGPGMRAHSAAPRTAAVPGQQHPSTRRPHRDPRTALTRGHAECCVCSSAPPEARRTPSRKAPSSVWGRMRRGSVSG